MASETTTTSLDDLCAAIIAEANMTVGLGADLRQICTQRDLPKGKSGVTFPLYGAASFASVNEGTDLANQSISTTSATITPTEHGAMTTLTDMAEWASNPAQVGADIGRLFAEAARAERNQTIWALFDAFTTNTAGTTNVDITEAAILSAVRQLMNAQAPPPYYMPITPHVFEDLLTLYSTNSNQTADQIRNSVLNSGIMPPIYGVIPLLVDNLASGSSAAGKRDSADAKCAVLSTAALGYVEGYPGVGFKLEYQRDASLRAWEIVATTKYAVGELVDAYGCEVLVDNKD